MGDAEMADDEGLAMTVGERLRAAREAAGLTLEDIATSTRIPTRHLESLEASDFSRLPAPTYSVGFAKNYAAAVGLDRAEIGDQLRAQMGGTRPTSTMTDVFEPADPARAMPKWLIAGVLVAMVLAALLFNWLYNRSLDESDAVAASNIVAPATAPVQATPQAQGPVVITANDTAWIEVKDGDVVLKQGELATGQSFEVPANAAAPTLTTAKAEALRISVGTADAPAIGPAATKITVSLKPDDLLRPRAAPPVATAPAAASPAAPAPPRPAATRRPAGQQPPATPPPGPAAETAAEPTNPQQ